MTGGRRARAAAAGLALGLLVMTPQARAGEPPDHGLNVEANLTFHQLRLGYDPTSPVSDQGIILFDQATAGVSVLYRARVSPYARAQLPISSRYREEAEPVSPWMPMLNGGEAPLYPRAEALELSLGAMVSAAAWLWIDASYGLERSRLLAPEDGLVGWAPETIDQRLASLGAIVGPGFGPAHRALVVAPGVGLHAWAGTVTATPVEPDSGLPPQRAPVSGVSVRGQIVLQVDRRLRLTARTSARHLRASPTWSETDLMGSVSLGWRFP